MDSTSYAMLYDFCDLFKKMIIYKESDMYIRDSTANETPLSIFFHLNFRLSIIVPLFYGS